MSKHIQIFLVVIIVLIAFGLYATYQNRKMDTFTDGKDYTAFSQCLTEKGFTMYGSKTCIYCQREKQSLGPAFENINYVECPENINLCIEKGVEAYPTWISSEGISYTGYQGPEKLASISGCVLPE
jgi:hypothetical protein